MSKVICEQEELVNIADAIREKTGSSEEMALSEMAGNVRGITGSGATSWNDLTDRPFGEVNGDTFTWDGNTDGKICIPELGLYLISDKPFSSDDVENGMKVTIYYKQHNAEQSHELRDYEIYINSDGFITDESVFSVPYDNYVATELGGIVFPSAGTYALNIGDIYVSSITIPGCTDFIVTKLLDVKYLPESHQFGEIGGSTLTWDGDTTDKLVVQDSLALVSNSVITAEDIEDGISIEMCMKETGEKSVLTPTAEELAAGVLADGGIYLGYALYAPRDNYDFTLYGITITIPKQGIYFMSNPTLYTSRLTINNYTGFLETKKLDAKYLPESVFKPTVLYVDTYTWLCRTPDGDDESNRITKDELMDIVKNSIAIQIYQYEVDDTYIKYVTNVHFNAYKEYGEVAVGYNGDRYYTSEYVAMQS